MIVHPLLEELYTSLREGTLSRYPRVRHILPNIDNYESAVMSFAIVRDMAGRCMLCGILLHIAYYTYMFSTHM